MTRPKPPRCPDCRRPLVLSHGVYECAKCGVGWTPDAILPK